MRIMLLTSDRETARAYADAAEQTGNLRLCVLKNTAQVLERLFRDPFDSLLTDDPFVLCAKIRGRPVQWPEYTFYLYEKPNEMNRLSEFLTFCFSRDADPGDVLSRIALFPENRRHSINREILISRFLQRAGVPVSLNGFAYLGDALKLILARKNPLDIRSVNDIYEILSMAEGVSPYVAEHAIRHAIDAAWMRAEISVLEDMFGFTVRSDRGVPSNAAFLFRIADEIKLKEGGTYYDTERNV